MLEDVYLRLFFYIFNRFLIVGKNKSQASKQIVERKRLLIFTKIIEHAHSSQVLGVIVEPGECRNVGKQA